MLPRALVSSLFSLLLTNSGKSASSSRGLLVAANQNEHTVLVIDLVNRKLTIPVAKRVQRISMSTDGSRVFTHDQGCGRIATMDTAIHKVARWIDIPDYAYASTPRADGRWLLAGLPRANRIVALDMQTLKVAKSFDSRWSDRTAATSPSSPACLRGKSRSSICAPGGCSPRST